MGSAARTELACLRSAMGERRNGIADLRSAIQRANHARFYFNMADNFDVTDDHFRTLEAAYLETKNHVRDALGALGLGPSEINQLGEVLS